jgi:hypothetical protein
LGNFGGGEAAAEKGKILILILWQKNAHKFCEHFYFLNQTVGYYIFCNLHRIGGSSFS